MSEFNNNNFKLIFDKYAFYDMADRKPKFIREYYEKKLKKKLDVDDDNSKENISYGKLGIFENNINLKISEEIKKSLEEKNKKTQECYSQIGYKTITSKLKFKGKIVLDFGAPTVSERGMKLHHIYGIPYISASTIKGLLRSYVESKLENNEESLGIDFGNDEQMGNIIIHDAFPNIDNKIKITFDSLVPMYDEYYDKGKTPYRRVENYNIIKVPCLDRGTEMVFNLSHEDKKIEVKLKKILRDALDYYGIGGKKNIGYGYLSNAREDKEGSNMIEFECQDKIENISESRIKSAMRFWWRSIIGSELTKEIDGKNETILKLLELEKKYFGSTENRCPFRLQLKVTDDSKVKGLIMINKNENEDENTYSIDEYTKLLELSLILSGNGSADGARNYAVDSNFDRLFEELKDILNIFNVKYTIKYFKESKFLIFNGNEEYNSINMIAVSKNYGVIKDIKNVNRIYKNNKYMCKPILNKCGDQIKVIGCKFNKNIDNPEGC